MFGRLAMGFANVRAGTRVLMLVLVQVYAYPPSAAAKACSLFGVGRAEHGADDEPQHAGGLVERRRGRLWARPDAHLHQHQHLVLE